MSRQIVITLPEWTEIKQIDNKQFADLLPAYDEMLNMIKNGTPLPKGHGRLIDGDLLKENYPHDTDWEYPVNTNQYVCDTIDAMATIIEADKV